MERNASIEQTVADLLHDLPRERGELLPALWRVMEHYQQLGPDVLEAVSQSTGIPYAEVYGVASFYALFENASGKTPVYVCADVMCALVGAEALKDAAEAAAEGTSVVVRESACLGQCDYAPAVWSGDQLVRHASPEKVARVVKEVAHE